MRFVKAAAAVCLFLLLSSYWPASAQEGARETPQVELARTSVRGLTIVGVRRLSPDRETVVVTLRNDTGRTILSFGHKRGEKIKGEERWQTGGYSSRGFDSTLALEVGWPPGEECDLLLDPDRKPLRIVAIEFDDYTVDGDEFWADAMRSARRHLQRQMLAVAARLERMPGEEVAEYLRSREGSDEGDGLAVSLVLDVLKVPGVTPRDAIARLKARGEGRSMPPLQSSPGGLKIGQ
ncbi:MAG TPA: hypothetical protein VEY09_02380 [Pyrinomonadaceae bacterium]|nr:hypothetical protein [Pyrinomonadaceae bacterium]